MNTQRDTSSSISNSPRTDALVEYHAKYAATAEQRAGALCSHARQLERELADARAAFVEYDKKIKAGLVAIDGKVDKLLGAQSATAAVSAEAIKAAEQWEHLEASGGLPITHPAFKICVKEILRLVRSGAGAGDALDAKRYRWLRDFGASNVLTGETASYRPGLGPYVRYDPPAMNQFSGMVLSGALVDAAIDTAIAATEEGNK